ncbi:hypothetical protein ACVIWU_003545 [Bradyrhizobium sp. USDA 4509]
MHLSTKPMTVAGIVASLTLGFAVVTLSPAPAKAVIYCEYVGYPHGCVARAGVVLRPRPVARAAVRHNAGGNLNGGVNRVGVRRYPRRGQFLVTPRGQFSMARDKPVCRWIRPIWMPSQITRAEHMNSSCQSE